MSTEFTCRNASKKGWGEGPIPKDDYCNIACNGQERKLGNDLMVTIRKAAE